MLNEINLLFSTVEKIQKLFEVFKTLWFSFDDKFHRINDSAHLISVSFIIPNICNTWTTNFPTKANEKILQLSSCVSVHYLAENIAI